MKIFVSNKKALFDYEVLDKKEAGLVLFGWEVKAIKDSRANLTGSFITVKDNEAFLKGAQVSRLKTSTNIPQEMELRDRKLLLRKKEIENIFDKTKEKGLTIVPLELYTQNNLIKVTVALVKGRKKFDKREKMKKRDIERDIARSR